MSKALRGLGEGLASVGKTLLDDALQRRRDEVLGRLRAEEQARADAAAGDRLDRELSARAKEGAEDRKNAIAVAKLRGENTTSVKVDDLTKVIYATDDLGKPTGTPLAVEMLDYRDGSRDVIPWADYVRLQSAKVKKPGAEEDAPTPDPAKPSAPEPVRLSEGIDTRTEAEKRRSKVVADAEKVKKGGLFGLPDVSVSVSAAGNKLRYTPTT